MLLKYPSISIEAFVSTLMASFGDTVEALVAKGYSMDVVDMDSLSTDSDTIPAKRGDLIGFDGHKRIEGTKIHAAVNEQSAPISVTIGKGSEHEGRKLIPLLKSISIRHGKGRPRKNPKRVYADTRYHMHLNRFYLDNRKIISQMPTKATKKRPGRPRLFDEETYHGVRYSVERFFAWTENFRKLTIRYERLPQAFSGLFHLACIMILWRVLR